MEREKKRNYTFSLIYRDLAVICFFSIFVGSVALLSNTKSRPLLKFCFNSRDQFVAAQCVLCDFYQFSATILGCNGRTSALMSNITSTEAVCIISNCLQQVRQAQPQFTGRRKRDSENSPPTAAGIANNRETDEPEFLDAKEELSVALPSVKDFLDRYVFMDEQTVKELEESVVDRIEVNVAEEDDQDYE